MTNEHEEQGEQNESYVCTLLDSLRVGGTSRQHFR